MPFSKIKAFEIRHYAKNGVEWVEITVVLDDGSTKIICDTENDAYLIRVVMQEGGQDARTN